MDGISRDDRGCGLSDAYEPCEPRRNTSEYQRAAARCRRTTRGVRKKLKIHLSPDITGPDAAFHLGKDTSRQSYMGGK